MSVSRRAAPASDRNGSSLASIVGRDPWLPVDRVREDVFDERVLGRGVVGNCPVQDALPLEVTVCGGRLFSVEERVVELGRRVLDRLSTTLLSAGWF